MNDRLDEIRARWAAVTPGAWHWAHHGSWEVEADPNVLVADCGTEGRAQADARAIARAPADIDTLLAALALTERERDAAIAALAEATRPRPIDEYHEDDGVVLWWQLPVCEPPYVGTTIDDDFPAHATHWTLLLVPTEPEEGGHD